MKSVVQWGLLVASILATFYSFAPGSASARGLTPIGSPFNLTLTIPDDNAGMDISNPDFHFTVILRNISDHPVAIWKRQCLLGAEDIQFYIDSVDGKVFNPPEQLAGCESLASVSRIPNSTSLKPGEIEIREFYLHEPAPNLVNESKVLPEFDPQQEIEIEMHVVMGSPGSEALAKRFGVWDGITSSVPSAFILTSVQEYRSNYRLTIQYLPSYTPASNLILKK